MQHPQRQQHPLTATHAACSVPLAALALLLLMSVLALLWQGPLQANAAEPAVSGAHAAPAKRQGEDSQQQRPALLRRAITLPQARTPLAAADQPAYLCVNANCATRSLIPATLANIARSPPGRRQQRGQAPPLG